MAYDKEKKSIIDFFHALTQCDNNTTLEQLENNGIVKPKDALTEASNYIYEIDGKPTISPFEELHITDNLVSFVLNESFIALLAKAMTWRIDDVLNHPESDTVRVIVKPLPAQEKTSFFNAKNIKIGATVIFTVIALAAAGLFAFKNKPIDYEPFITKNLQTLFPTYQQMNIVGIEKAEQENSYNVAITYTENTGAKVSKTIWIALHEVNSGSDYETTIVVREFKELTESN